LTGAGRIGISVHPDGLMSIRATPSSRADALLGWMDGLADPTRLRIMRVLERGPLSVLETCEVLRLPQSTVSRHLKVLADGGWLAGRRQGTQSLYAWAPEIAPGARKLWLVARAETDGWPAARQDGQRLDAVRARRDEAQRFFAGAVGAWDRLRAEAYGRAFERDALLALLPSAWTIADLGCGTGSLAAELAPRFRRVIAVDRSGAMLRAARRRTAPFPNVEIHEAPLEALPVPDATCDAALLVLVLGYVADPAPVVAEAARILAPGGRLVAVDAARHADETLRARMGQARPGFEEAELAALLAGGGLEAPPARLLPPDPAAKGPGLVLATGVKSVAGVRPRARDRVDDVVPEA
jgi:ArsR family transcriptional regulator